jgi:hypothetical protein
MNDRTLSTNNGVFVLEPAQEDASESDPAAVDPVKESLGCV